MLAKRLFDITISLIILFSLTPLFLIIPLAIAFTDGFPVYFKQTRAGQYGKKFTLLKFRSMSVDKTKKAKESDFDAGSIIRVTQVGKFIRKTKLDELPQIINVLRGEMSFVGPRPEVCKWVMEYPDLWSKVHTVKPGITDLASIIYRNEESILSVSPDPEKTYRETILPHKLSLYEQYVDNHSFWGDIKIIFQTIFALFR